MHITYRQSYLDIVRRCYNFSHNAYINDKGQLAIGYGFTKLPGNLPVNFDSYIEKKEADKILEKEVISILYFINDYLNDIPLHTSQIAALISLIYDIGTEAFIKSPIKGFLKEKQYLRAGNWFCTWDYITLGSTRVKVADLKKRRIYERDIFVRSLPKHDSNQVTKVNLILDCESDHVLVQPYSGQIKLLPYKLKTKSKLRNLLKVYPNATFFLTRVAQINEDGLNEII